MPRPRKPTNPPEYDPESGIVSTKPINISEDDLDHAVSIMHVKDQEEFQKVKFETSWQLYNYPFHEFDTRPTPASLIAVLKSIKVRVTALRKAIDDLDYYTEEQLNQFGVGMIELMMIFDFEKKLTQGIEWLSRSSVPGRPRNLALRVTMASLARVYYQFRNPNSGDWREFISTALKAAHISHPDPDEERSRFDKLLPKEALKVLLTVP